MEDGTPLPAILDVCCGTKAMWFDKNHPDAVFGDLRQERITVTDRSHRHDGTRILRIEPDLKMDFRNLPWPDETFRLVAFDPPHLTRAGRKSWMAAKYGKLSGNWKEDLIRGFEECFRVLKPEGVLVFKWNETHVRIREILDLSPIPPLFGHTSGRGGLTHWMVFVKSAR